GGHAIGRAGDALLSDRSPRVERDAEVADGRRATAGQEKISRFDITMNDAGLMDGVEALRRINHDPADRVDGQAQAALLQALDHLAQIDPINVALDQKS